jgi:IclR family mhp operon transcriptional activator
LRLINQRQGIGLNELHRLSGLPKPTVFRILLTLQQEGYVEPDGIPGVYHLTSKVQELSAGYSETSLIVKIGAPIVAATTKAIKWPLAIGTLDGDAMVVRCSTMPRSPLAIQTTTLGHRLNLLESAMGRAYISGCTPATRATLADLACERSPVDAERVIRQAVALGYGLRLPTHTGDSASLAVPVRGEEDPLAVVSLTTFGNTMNNDFIARLLPSLRSTAEDIRLAYLAHTAGQA